MLDLGTRPAAPETAMFTARAPLARPPPVLLIQLCACASFCATKSAPAAWLAAMLWPCCGKWAHLLAALFAGTDEWSIHKGSCGYGALWRDEPHGWDVSWLITAPAGAAGMHPRGSFNNQQQQLGMTYSSSPATFSSNPCDQLSCIMHHRRLLP